MNHSLKVAAVVAFAWLATVVGSTSAADWGSLKGRVVVDGTPTKPAPLVVTKDQYCIDKMPTNQSILVGKNNALENVVVYLRVSTGQKVEVNPEYAAKESEPVVLDNNGCAFHPHVTLARM